MLGTESHPEPRCQWEGLVGLGLVAVFVLLGLPLLLFATVMEIGLGHALFVLVTMEGLWVSVGRFGRSGRQHDQHDGPGNSGQDQGRSDSAQSQCTQQVVHEANLA